MVPAAAYNARPLNVPRLELELLSLPLAANVQVEQ